MLRGEKVHIDLGSDSEEDRSHAPTLAPAALVGDVLERKPAAPKPPSAPAVKNQSGFPGHQKRVMVSRFRQQKETPSSGLYRDAKPAPSSVSADEPAGGKTKSWEEEQKERIDGENNAKLAGMSAEEIEEERRELWSQFSPAVLQKLLARSNVASGSEETHLSQLPGEIRDTPDAATLPAPDAVRIEVPDAKDRAKLPKTVAFADEPDFEEADALANSSEPPPAAETLPHDSIHFPRPAQPPSLDPSSSTFLTDLHEKYFPSLPSDPDKLEWMQTTSGKNAYDPSSAALNASEIRFNFKGDLIPPSKANEIPVTQGLHHHGDAPEAAGYTIAELAHLSRSSYAAQRCIAFQTLGRILYKLSKKEFGDPGEPEQVLQGDVVEGPEDTFGELARGLWREVERLQVIPMLVDESEGRGVDGGRHVSAKAYATEAVWLWRKGGGRRWDAK